MAIEAALDRLSTGPMTASQAHKVLRLAGEAEQVIALSTHDKVALKTPSDPMGAIEEYYDEYLAALRDAVQVLSRHSSSIMLGIINVCPSSASFLPASVLSA